MLTQQQQQQQLQLGGNVSQCCYQAERGQGGVTSTMTTSEIDQSNETLARPVAKGMQGWAALGLTAAKGAQL